MFKSNQMQFANKPPSQLVEEALRLWGKSIKKSVWEQIDLKERNQFTEIIKTFHCPTGNVCEIIELHNFKFQENGHNVQYGLGRCLSCAKIYWGKIDRDSAD
ncbi:MAG: hypothetical protein ACM3YE_08105 [Bacteroidota bacterium]